MSCNNDNSRTLSTDPKFYNETVPSSAATAKNKSKVKQKFRFCFKFSAFVFSHVGLGFLVLAYTIFGAFVFKHFEESRVGQHNIPIADIRNSTVNKLWTETYKLNVLYKENWTAMAIKEIEQFQRTLLKAMKEGQSLGEDGNNRSNPRWSFSDSWMYSISIITTIGYANRPSTSEGKIATIFYALFGIPIMLLFLSTIGNLLGKGLKSLHSFCCTCSNERHNSLANLHTSHDHHLHEDYQVHHIALNNINLNSGNSNSSNNNNRHVVACNPSAISNNVFAANNKNFSLLNSNFHPRCSYETGEFETETKLCADSIDHLCSDKLSAYAGHSHNCNYMIGLETPTFYRSDLGKIHSHPSLPNSIYEESNCDSIPFYFCFLLIVVYILCGAFMFYIWEDWSILDGAYFCFVTLSTIGFGDIVPEKTFMLSQTESKKRIILIVIYILGGMTLIAMSFNIIYEQLVYKFRNIGNKFQLPNESNHGGGGGRDIKIVTNEFISSAEDIDV